MESYKGEAFAFQIDSAFDCKLYNDELDTFARDCSPAPIAFFGPGYGWQGHDFKFYGPIGVIISLTRKSFKCHHLCLR